jgi:hypothetical protein
VFREEGRSLFGEEGRSLFGEEGRSLLHLPYNSVRGPGWADRPRYSKFLGKCFPNTVFRSTVLSQVATTLSLDNCHLPTHAPIYQRTHAPTYPRTYAPTHQHTNAPTHSHTHAPTDTHTPRFFLPTISIFESKTNI